jgi:hypothetical protein
MDGRGMEGYLIWSCCRSAEKGKVRILPSSPSPVCTGPAGNVMPWDRGAAQFHPAGDTGGRWECNPAFGDQAAHKSRRTNVGVLVPRVIGVHPSSTVTLDSRPR